LVTLEAVRPRTGDATNQIRSAQGQINELIKSLRAALDDLRRARGQESSPLALGFVLERIDGSGPVQP
jgi:hypothetical protein